MTDDASTHNSSFQAENFDSAVNGHSPKFSESTKMPIDDIPSDFEGSDLSSIHSDSESPPLKIMRPSTPIRSNPGPRNTRSPFKAGKTKYNARKKSDTIYAKDIDLDNWPIEDFIHSPKASSMPNTPTKKSKPKNAQPAKASDSTTSNVNKRNRVGRTKLFRSVERGDFEQCKEFVEEGADTTLRDNGGWGLIHIACGKGHLEIAKFLIEKGAPINITGLYGQTPLHDAAQINHFGLVKLLLESGAHINSRDCQGKTALDMSEDEDIIVYIKQILQQIHQNQYRDEKGQTSLHLACIQGDLDLANKYLDEGSNINAKDDEGWTSLHRAALYGHADIVNELITRNVDVNAHGYLGDTPLHDACYNNHFDIVELLLQNGADPFLCNDNDEFPLHVATDSEVQSILKEFVDRPKVTTLRRNAKRALQFKEHSPVNHLIAAAVDQPETENFSKQQLKENGEEEENDVEQEVEMKQEMEMEVDSNLNNISMSAELTSVSELSDIGDTETESLDKVEVKLSNEYPELKMEFKESIDCKITNQKPPIKNQDEKNKLSPQSPKLFTPHSPPEKPPRKKRQRNTLSSKDIETLKSTLYMVSIPLADNPSTLFVVDLQVQLVLDMTLPEEGLISLYPYLYRRQVTKPEKERLWKHFRRILEPLIEISVGKVGPDQKIGKKDFLKLVMNFVKMDEIIDLIKDKYSNLSSNLITIELDLGYNESNSAEEPSKKQNLKLISPTSIDLPEKPLIISPECSATESQPVKREPSSSLDFILGPSSPKRISSPKQLASPRIPSLKNILDNPDILDNPYPTSTPTSPVQSPNNRMPPKLARKLRHRNSISDHGGYQHI